MTKNEIAWAAQALVLAKQYDNSNPDVGMPPSPHLLLERITPDGVILSLIDAELIFKEAKKISHY